MHPPMPDTVDPLPVPCRYKYAASVTQYQSCTVDPRPGRAVHCPDLNACLVNEGRTDPVDCQATHFGYAIPVTVVPLPERPDLAQLVFDPTPDLTPEALAYLLRHHPVCRDEVAELDNMATTKHEQQVRNKFAEPPEEDIAAIAKQISDHAEAIYQTWKSRGLAPAEILTCHSNAQAADKFGTALTPGKSREMASSRPASAEPSKSLPRENHVRPATADPGLGRQSPTPSINANNLEELVANFVVEDKARVAAARGKTPTKPLPSSIQFALQKFEKNAGEKPAVPFASKPSPPYDKPVVQYATKPSPPYQPAGEATRPYVHKPAPPYQPPQEVPKVNHKAPAPPYRGVVQDTIETTFPAELPKSPETESSGMTTWPLKNKAVTRGGEGDKFSTLPAKEKQAQTARENAEYMDEVAREEERLINALKTGIIIAEEPPGLESSQIAEKKKKNLLLKKNKVKKKSKDDSPEASPTKQSPTKEEVDLSNLSLVDYAKVRYRAAQQTPLTQQRLDDVRELDQQLAEALDSHGRQIVAARTKFEEVDGAGQGHRRQQSLPGAGGVAAKKPSRAPGHGRPADGVPHPELTDQQRLRAAAHATSNPVRPFLTRGSVAERVLIFEKCPTELLLDKRRGAPAIAAWRSGNEVQAKAQSYVKDKPLASDGVSVPNTTLQRHVRANRSAAAGDARIPRFYFPRGKPTADAVDVTPRVTAAFAASPGGRVPREKFGAVTKACDLPLYWKVPLFNAVGGAKNGFVELAAFLDFWNKLSSSCHDEAARFVYVVTKGARDYVLPEDLVTMVQDVVDTHPGLTFLKEAIEFHSRYVHTVIARIFYCANRSWSGRLSLAELRRSDVLRILRLLEVEDDINQVTAYFSYEHFYVIYCKFWELDRDHDLYIDKTDLQRHNDHALSSRMIERIFSGAVTRGGRDKTANRADKMSYTEFVWFLLSEEDKHHPTAVEYWFRCMDLDGDGVLSMYELEYFYEEQLHRLEAIGIETLPFQDCLCQMLDMVHPARGDRITLSDLRRCKTTSIFFDTFFNLEKYLEHEQRDPFAAQRDPDEADASDWDRFAADEYEALVAEEAGNEDMMYDDGEGDDIFSPNLDQLAVSADEVDDPDAPPWRKPKFKVTDFDDYDEDGDYARDSDDCSV